MEENRCKRRREDSSSDQAQNNQYSFLRGEPDSWTMNYSEMLASENMEDCVSEAPERKSNQPQILADRVQSSIENLRLFYDWLSSLVGLSHSSESCGRATHASEGSSLIGTQETSVTQGGDLKDLLSSLQFLLSVVKKHEEMQRLSQAKLQALREQKAALRLEKQQYKDKCKRQHIECLQSGSISQEL